MSITTLETVELLLEGALEGTEDTEVHYKLRTALQLLVVIEEDYLRVHEALENVEIEDDIRQQLQELGYIE